MATVSLDPEQYEAVHSPGNLLITACPGSGKTRVLSVRGAKHLSDRADGVLCAVSFTRDSAEELKVRIGQESEVPTQNRVVTGTFHALAIRQIRNAEKRGTRKGIRRIATAQQLNIALTRAIDVSEWAESLAEGVNAVEEAVKTIERLKSQWAPIPKTNERALLYQYNSILERNGICDFADLLLEAVQGMGDGTIRPVPAKWLLVDEAQDMDEVQLEWVMRHVKASLTTTLVGDDDQCHPAGVLVATASGVQVPVESISSRSKVIVVEEKGRGALRAGKVASQVKTARRPYIGPMLTFSVSGREVQVTPNHKMLMRFSDAGKSMGVVILVAIPGGGYYLAGCGLTEASRHLGKRSSSVCGTASVGKAALWVISAHDSADAARDAAIEIGKDIGLPVRRRGELRPDRYLEVIGVDGMKRLALDVLARRSLALERPLMTEDHVGVRRPEFICAAEHALPGMFELPVVGDGNLVAWSPIQAITSAAFEGDVYSLGLQPSPLYVANGIVVHNSIYEWRNALGIEGLRRFEREAMANHVVLGRCYRCAPEILTEAAKVISFNTVRQPKQLKSMAEFGGEVEVSQWADQDVERSAVANRVADDPGTWAILARTNSLLIEMAGVLQERGIEYKMAGSGSIWEKGPAEVFTNLLKAVDKDDGTCMITALMRLQVMDADMSERLGLGLNDPAQRYIISGSAEAVRLLGRSDEGESGDIGVKRKAKGLPKNLKMLKSLGKQWNHWKRLLSEGEASYPLICSSVASWAKTGLAHESQGRMMDRCAKIIGRGKGTLTQRVMRATNQDETDDGIPRVALHSLHSSKGLEFPNVWMIGCEHGTLPIVGGIREEERRLMYVGMTRAKRRLVMSFSMHKAEQSGFMVEAGLLAGPRGK